MPFAAAVIAAARRRDDTTRTLRRHGQQALGVWSTDYIPRGTRFGPLAGQVYRKDQVPEHANRSYFWRVYEDKEQDDFYYIDGFDVDKANWMRYVNAAFSAESQNLVACQIGKSIYFYTIKHILPHQELLVWYCREFAMRLNYPLSGQLMIQALSEYSREESP